METMTFKEKVLQIEFDIMTFRNDLLHKWISGEFEKTYLVRVSNDRKMNITVVYSPSKGKYTITGTDGLTKKGRNLEKVLAHFWVKSKKGGR